MQLKLSTRIENGVTIVDCNGRIVFGEESALLRDTLKKLIVENSQIVLNLGGISYIDSGGLGTLVALYTTAQNAGGAVKLANLTQRVGRSAAGHQTADGLRGVRQRGKSHRVIREGLLSS